MSGSTGDTEPLSPAGESGSHAFKQVVDVGTFPSGGSPQEQVEFLRQALLKVNSALIDKEMVKDLRRAQPQQIQAIRAQKEHLKSTYEEMKQLVNSASPALTLANEEASQDSGSRTSKGGIGSSEKLDKPLEYSWRR